MKRGTHLLAFALAFGSCALAGLVLPRASAERPARARRHAGITEGLDCAACHNQQEWKSLSDGTGGGFDHDRTGFPLRGLHARTACTQCHRADEPITRECSGCHSDPHQRRLGGDCAECHGSQSFARSDAFERHRRTRLPLTGMHALSDCTDCHRRTTDGQWSSAPADCYACHADAYRRSDVHPVHVGGQGDPPSAPLSRNCAECHRPTGWSPAFIPVNAFDAQRSALALRLSRLPPDRHELLFPIRHGAHRDAECSDCHGSERVAQALRCTGCHAHNPVALRARHARMPAAQRDGACLRCHHGGMAR